MPSLSLTPRPRSARLTGTGETIYSGRVSPYRHEIAPDTLEVPTREGLLRLELAPRHVVMELGDHIRFEVAEHFATLLGQSRRNRRKKRRFPLEAARLILARTIPSEGLGIWYSPDSISAIRLFGCRPLDLFDENGLEALRRLDRASKRLGSALVPYGDGIERAKEIGHGADRVLITDYGDHLVFYVRRLFREKPQRALEVWADGTIRLPARKRLRSVDEQVFQCNSRYGVTSIGDYVRFADRTGQDLGSVPIPWITTEERQEIVDIIGERIDQS